MGRFGCFLFGLLVGAITVFVSLKYHIVRAADGHHLIPKVSAEFGGTYVDVRSFGFRDWAEHKSLAAAIARSGKSDLMTQATVNSVTDRVNDYLDIDLGQPQ